MTAPTGGPAIDAACQRALDHVSAMVRVWTPDAGVRYVNRPWRELTGSSVDANAGDRWLQFVHEEDRTTVAASLASGADLTTRYRLVTRDGAPLVVSDVAAPWTDDDGRLLGVMHTVTVQSPDASPTAAVMSKWAHELRGPLNAILGWSDLLSSGETDPNVLERGMKAIAANARQQALIIKRMTE